MIIPVLLTHSLLVAAQDSSAIPIRTLAPPVARMAEPIVEYVGGVRQLAGGRVLVNDIGSRRVLLLDTTLRVTRVLIDSVAGLANSYPRAGGALIPFRGDTTLFVDADARVLLTIDPQGNLGRVIAPPRAQDISRLRSTTSVPGFDPRGRLVYVGQNPANHPSPRGLPPGVTLPLGKTLMTLGGTWQMHDSMPLVRADFDTRTVDTLTRVNVATTRGTQVLRDNATGEFSGFIVVNPIPQAVDEWAVLPGGAVVVLRAQDYRLEWLEPDGTWRSTGRLPYDWVRLSDADKQAKIDSARAAIDSVNDAGGRYGEIVIPAPTGTQRVLPVIEYEPINNLPEYIPPFRAGAMQADADGNLWILPTMSASARGGLLYDVVNGRGELFERVQLPPDRVVAGFGPGGVVYLAHRTTTPSTVWTLERTRVSRDGAR